MKEYEVFDKYLAQYKEIQTFIDERLNLMLEVFKISKFDTDAKIFWFEKIGSELEAVLEVILKMEKERNSLGMVVKGA